MRRTDEAFKNELFRRYGQYKKNRRSLRFLAATPLAACVIICAIVCLPRLNLRIDTGNSPIGAQPNETTEKAPSPNENDPIIPGGALPSITEAEMQALIDEGGTFHDLIALIGEPHTSITSGLYTPAWNLADGRMLILRIEINELSTPIPIDGYTFWESPMQAIVEMLKYCDIGNITVTEGVQDNAVFYRSYTDQTNIDAIRELIYDCTRLSVMGGPTEVDPATINPIQGSSRMFQLNGTPDPDYYGGNMVEADLYYTIELLDTSDGLFLGYSDYNIGGVATQWFKISPESFNALWEYVETHGEGKDDGTVKENPFYGITNNPIHTVSVTGPYGTHIFKDDEATRLVKLLDQLTSKVYRETIIDNMDGITFYIEVDWTPEPDATGAIPDEYSRCTFELFGHFLRAPDREIEEWYEVDGDAAQALIDYLTAPQTGGDPEPDLPFTDARERLDILLNGNIALKATAEMCTPEYDRTYTFDSTPELSLILTALETLFQSDYAAVDQAYIDSISDMSNGTDYLSLSIWQEIHPEPDYNSMYKIDYLQINLIHGKYLRYRIDGGVTSDWYEINDMAASKLIDLIGASE